MKTVLVVDDEPTIVDIIEDLLRQNGLNTIPAGDAAAAEQVLARSLPDLMLLDVMMPKVNGFDFAKKLRGIEAYQKLPIIFVTVMNKKEDIERGQALGAADYIIKPFDPAKLVASVKKALGIAD